MICDVELTTRRPILAEGFQDTECASSRQCKSTGALLPLVAPECFDGSSRSCLVKPDCAMRPPPAPRLSVHFVRKYAGKIVIARRDVDVPPAGLDLDRLVTASTIRSARCRPCTAWRMPRCRAATAARLLLRSPSARRVSPRNMAASSAASSSFKRATAAARALVDNAGSMAAILAAQCAPMACALLAVALADCWASTAANADISARCDTRNRSRSAACKAFNACRVVAVFRNSAFRVSGELRLGLSEVPVTVPVVAPGHRPSNGRAPDPHVRCALFDRLRRCGGYRD